MIPQRQPHGAAFAVRPAEGVLVEHAVLAGRAAEQVDLLGVEHAACQHEAIGH